jgi:hypothetical protein
MIFLNAFYFSPSTRSTLGPVASLRELHARYEKIKAACKDWQAQSPTAVAPDPNKRPGEHTASTRAKFFAVVVQNAS